MKTTSPFQTRYTKASVWALLLLSCDALWSGYSMDNADSCVTNAAVCSANLQCNEISGLCEPLPSVRSFSPVLGPSSGGVDINVSGSNFTPSTSLSFGGVPAVVRYVSSTALVATLPSHPGVGDCCQEQGGQEHHGFRPLCLLRHQAAVPDLRHPNWQRSIRSCYWRSKR